MAKRKFEVQVTQMVEVELDDDIINEEFMAEFRESFYPFNTIEAHAKHIGQLEARGLLGWDTDIVEGYGVKKDAKIQATITYQEEDVTEIV